jgi:predicted GNAT superfamily acetyltransferase
MILRKGEKKDIEQILLIIEDAKEALKSMGIDQWQNGYPNREIIEKDINSSEAYVLEEEGQVKAYGILTFGGEESYNSIYDGEWLSQEIYGTIHRIAVKSNEKGRGISHKFLGSMEKICIDKEIKSIKIDTHRDNKIMQNILTKNNYTYCGIIYLQDGSERLAYEKILF